MIDALSQTRPSRWRVRSVVLSLVLGVCASGQAQRNVQLDLRVEPSQLRVGEVGRLVLRIQGASQYRVPIPRGGEGYDFPGAPSTRTNIHNGEVGHVYSLPIRGTKEGEHQIPGLQVYTPDGLFRSRGVTLQVAPASASSPPIRRHQSPRFQIPPQYRAPTQTTPATPSRPRATAPSDRLDPSGIELIFEPKLPKAYVGQSVPVDVIFAKRSDIRDVAAKSLPQLDSDAFTMSELNAEPTPVINRIGGYPCYTLPWQAVITPVREGEFNLSAEMKIEARVATSQPSGVRSPWSFMRPQQYQVVDKLVQSRPFKIEVEPLPTNGRPAVFNGAIGDFQVAIKSAEPKVIKTGEPITLTMEVTGRGNFDRVKEPVLESTEGWKVYPATRDVATHDESGYHSTAVFTQSFIPIDDKVTEMPDLLFSFFSPEAETYRLVRVSAPNVTIVPNPKGARPKASSTAAASQPAASTPREQEQNPEPEFGLMPIALTAGSYTRSFAPAYHSPVFWAAQAVPLLALLLGFLEARRRHRLENDPEFARSQQVSTALRDEIARMDQACRDQDAPTFFASARDAIRLKLGERWKMPPYAITQDLIRERAPQHSDSLQQLFDVADELSYSGRSAADTSLEDWRRAVMDQLRSLESV